MPLQNVLGALALESTLAAIRDRLAAVLDVKVHSSALAPVVVDLVETEIPLPAAQVTDLKSVTATLTNPTPAPETGLAKDVTLAAIRDRASFPLPATQVTDLKTVTVANPTANPETGLAKETTLAQVRDRADFPLPATQVTDLKTVTVSNPTADPETGLAKDATLELVRAQAAAINANTDAIESLLTTLRDEQMRRTDPLAAGANTIGKVQLDQAATHFITSSGGLKVAQGKVFIGGKAVSLGGVASTDRAVFRLSNPSTSTKIVYVLKFTIYSTIAQQVKYNEDGTITVDGTIEPRNLNRAMATPPASAVELTHGKSAITGGSDWPNESRVSPDVPLVVDFSSGPVPLGPGKSILVRGTLGDAQTFTVNAYWFEEPI